MEIRHLDALLAITEAGQGASFYQMVEYQKRIAEVIRTDPNVDALVSSVGGAASATLGGPNFGQLVVHLKPRAQRKLGVDQVMAEMQRANTASAIVGAGTPMSRALVEVHLPVPFWPAVSRILSTSGAPSSSFCARMSRLISMR